MYVHQNPKLSDLVDKIEDWEFSSFPDYIGKRNGTLVNIQKGLNIFQLNKSEIYGLTYKLLLDKFDEDFI
jgi:putative transposase